MDILNLIILVQQIMYSIIFQVLILRWKEKNTASTSLLLNKHIKC